jgi:putative phosphoesterase
MRSECELAQQSFVAAILPQFCGPVPTGETRSFLLLAAPADKIPSMNNFLLGLISDTHGLLRPESLAALQGSATILHAGDVGDSSILSQLKSIAPVHAVRGNIDAEPWARSLPLTETIELADVSIYMLHNLDQLDLVPKSAGIQIVVSGHTHKPDSHWRDGILYINPGSAGPRRFSFPTTVACLDLLKTPWQPEFVHLL